MNYLNLFIDQQEIEEFGNIRHVSFLCILLR